LLACLGARSMREEKRSHRWAWRVVSCAASQPIRWRGVGGGRRRSK
jgi:hypothetical protein